MSNFLDGLERDLVEGMRRYEARPEVSRRLRLPARRPRVLSVRVALAGAAVAVAVFAAVAGLPGIGGGGRDDVAVRVSLLARGTFDRDGFKLIVGDRRYSIVDARNDVDTGTIDIRGDRAVFSQDSACLAGGIDHGGTYRLRQSGRTLVIEPVGDICARRVRALRGTWVRSG